MDEENDIELNKEGIDDSVIAEERAEDKAKKLKRKLEQAETKAKEYLNRWQRAQADFANLRRRDEEAKSEFLKFANEGLLLEFLPVLDSFDIAISTDPEVAVNIKPIYRQILSVLEAHGLKVLKSEGEIFDPHFHESVEIIGVKDRLEDHRVLEVMQKGYILSGKIIRPAKVKIGEFNENK